MSRLLDRLRALDDRALSGSLLLATVLLAAWLILLCFVEAVAFLGRPA